MFQLVKVHENVHLVDKCIDLLNEEWPRDKSVRLRNINKSSDNFPLCLALVDEMENVLGFVKLTSELPFNQSIFLESLIVDKCNRTKGLGRFIMQEVEKLVKLSGFDRITLTTEDKEGFYLKMGYSRVFTDQSNQKSQQTLPSNDTSLNQCPPPPVPNLFHKFNPNSKVFMYKNI